MQVKPGQIGLNLHILRGESREVRGIKSVRDFGSRNITVGGENWEKPRGAKKGNDEGVKMLRLVGNLTAKSEL